MKGAIAKQLEFDGLSVISKISAARIIAQAITKGLQILIYLHNHYEIYYCKKQKYGNQLFQIPKGNQVHNRLSK